MWLTDVLKTIVAQTKVALTHVAKQIKNWNTGVRTNTLKYTVGQRWRGQNFGTESSG